MRKLNLGCGRDYKEGWINLDCREDIKLDVKHDLNKFPYPFKDNQFDFILMKDVLEHLDNPKEVMKEVHRISKNGAEVEIIVPHFSGCHAWQDVEHIRPYSVNTFRAENMTLLFELKKTTLTFPRIRFFIKWFANNFQSFYEKNLAFIFPAISINIKLKVKKNSNK